MQVVVFQDAERNTITEQTTTFDFDIKKCEKNNQREKEREVEAQSPVLSGHCTSQKSAVVMVATNEISFRI